MKYIVKGRRPRWLKNAAATPRGWVDARTGKMLFVTPLQIIPVPDEPQKKVEIETPKADIEPEKVDIPVAEEKPVIEPIHVAESEPVVEPVPVAEQPQKPEPKKRTSNRKRKTPAPQPVTEDGQV